MSDTMRAITVDAKTKALSWSEVPAPQPGAGEVRIRSAATAVNRADMLQRLGLYPPPTGASEILGLEVSGVVESVGEGVTTWSPGDRVCALLAGGGYAQQVVCPASHLLPVPESLSVSQAAALPEVFATAYVNLVGEAKMQPGQRILLHAGASGVGTAAIQVCRTLGNACWVTAGSADKIATCKALGAQDGANRHDGKWSEHVKEWTDGQGFDVILDPVGGAYLEDNISALAPGGRLILIGLLGGMQGNLSLVQVLMKQLRIVGSRLRNRSLQDKAEILSGMQADLWPALERGEIQPILHSVMPIDQVAEAFALMASNQTTGKIVLEIPQ